jgi:hypothetical protein
MGKKQLLEGHARVPGEQSDPEGVREVVLETLLQLHMDFASLGRLGDAGPLLYKLMEVAYYAGTPAKAGEQRDGSERKSVLN